MRGAGGQRRVPPEFIREWMIPDITVHQQERIADLLDFADSLNREQSSGAKVAKELYECMSEKCFG